MSVPSEKMVWLIKCKPQSNNWQCVYLDEVPESWLSISIGEVTDLVGANGDERAKALAAALKKMIEEF